MVMDIFNNQWVVGVGGGILSGLLVTFITRKFFESKNDKEHLQKISIANSEIIHAIKPFIVDGDVPSHEIIDSLQTATARKYNLDLRDVATITELVENLIKEIMDYSFISNHLKNEYCEKLSTLKPKSSELDVVKTYKSQAIAEYRQRVLSVFSAVLGVFAGLLTAYTAFMASSAEDILFSKLKILIPSFIAFLIAYTAFAFFRIRKDKSNNTEEKNA